jgi:ABC-2 type transport system permease protein
MFLAYGNSSGAGVAYYIATPIILLSFLMLGVVSGVLSAIILAALIPLHVSRYAVFALFVVALATILSALQMSPFRLSLGTMKQFSAGSVIEFVINHHYCPAQWVSMALTTLAQGSYTATLRAVGLMLPLVAVVWYLLEAAFTTLHARGYAKLQSHNQRTRGYGVGYSHRRLSIFGMFQRPVIAIASREFISFARDFTHTIQLGMLLGISVLYLYSLKGIEPPTHVGTTTLQLWDICLLAASVGLSAMIILSICTRFVFPSVSLEGQAFWILQASPLTHKEILTAKYRTWFVPIACMSAVVFASGGLALGVEPLLLGALVATGIIFAHGLVAVAINFGARFARFDWGHSAEIATTWGSLAYTATGCILIAISMIPVLLMLSVYILFPSMAQEPALGLAILGSGLFILWLLHILFGRMLAHGGALALEQLRR